MYVGYCVPCTLVIYNGRGAHQWNVQVKTLIAALYVSHLHQWLPLFFRRGGGF